MIRAILDTNVLLQALIGSPRSASARVLRAYRDGKFRLVFSLSTLDELLQVLNAPNIRARHGWSDDEILEYLEFLMVNADIYPGEIMIPASTTRDITDTKFLALAVESGARYLVTNDNRHLLRLRRYHQTQIVTPADFIRKLPG